MFGLKVSQMHMESWTYWRRGPWAWMITICRGVCCPVFLRVGGASHPHPFHRTHQLIVHWGQHHGGGPLYPIGTPIRTGQGSWVWSFFVKDIRHPPSHHYVSGLVVLVRLFIHYKEFRLIRNRFNTLNHLLVLKVIIKNERKKMRV